MSADLQTVADAADRRRQAKAELDGAVRALHESIRDAHQERWRVSQIAAAAGMHRVSIHEVLRGARYGRATAMQAATSELEVA